MATKSKRYSLPQASILIVSLLCFLLASRSSAQNKELDELARASYVERFTKYFFVWPVAKQKVTSFSIQDQATGRKITFKPNVPVYLGAGFYMFGIGAQILFALPINNSSVSAFGLSSAIDAQANIIGKNWGVDVFTQNYKGYYADDNDEPQNGSTPRKDITTRNIGANGIYYFNRRAYSMRATYNYYERQLKSAGSFLLTSDINIFSLRADSAIYGPSYQTYFGSNANFQRLDYTSFSVAPGYAYNFVVNKTYFIGASVAYGPAVNWLRFNNGTDPWMKEVNLNTYLDIRLAAGYNAERVFAGVAYSYQARNMIYDGVLLSSTSDVVKFSIGYRFVEKGILKRRAFDIFKPKSSW